MLVCGYGVARDGDWWMNGVWSWFDGGDLPSDDDRVVRGVTVGNEGVGAPPGGARPRHRVGDGPLEGVKHAPIDLGLGHGSSPVHMLQGRVRTPQRTARHASATKIKIIKKIYFRK